jgi:hypothetical protein
MNVHPSGARIGLWVRPDYDCCRARNFRHPQTGSAMAPGPPTPPVCIPGLAVRDWFVPFAPATESPEFTLPVLSGVPSLGKDA